MNFVTIADLENQVTEAVVGFEQHGFGVPVLRVRCNPAIGEPMYFPPCTADLDLALVLLPNRWLTQEALVEATHLYLRCSGEWGPARDEDIVIRRWAPLAPPREPVLGEAERACPATASATASTRGGARGGELDEGLSVFLYEGEIVCVPCGEQ